MRKGRRVGIRTKTRREIVQKCVDSIECGVMSVLKEIARGDSFSWGSERGLLVLKSGRLSRNYLGRDILTYTPPCPM